MTSPRLRGQLLQIPLLLCLAAGLLVVQPPVPESEPLDAHHLLLLPPGPEARVAVERMQAEWGVVHSRYTSTVRLTTFGPEALLRISDLENRLDPADPRRDPWINAAEDFFVLPRGNVFPEFALVPREQVSGSMERDLVRLFPEESSRPRGAGASAPWLLPLAVLVLIGAAIPVHGPRINLFRLATGGGGLFMFRWLGVEALVTLALLVVLAVDVRVWIEQRRRNRYWDAGADEGIPEPMLVRAAATAVSLLVSLFTVGPGILLAPLIIGLPALIAGLQQVLTEQRQMHRGFAAVRIMEKPPLIHESLAFSAAVFALGILLLLGLVRVTLPAPLPQALPVASPDSTGSNSWELLSDLEQSPAEAEGDVSRPLSLRDYVAHRARQASLWYRPLDGLPRRGEVIIVPRIRDVDGRLITEEEVVLEFGDEWLANVLQEPHSTEFVNVILAEGVNVVLAFTTNHALYSSNTTTWVHAVVVLLAWSLLLWRQIRRLAPRLPVPAAGGVSKYG